MSNRMSLRPFYRKKLPPARPINEIRLFHEVRAAYPDLEYAALSQEVLQRLTRDHGVDFATALWYDRIRRSDEQGSFIAHLEALEPDMERLPQIPGKLLLAPGVFYREFGDIGSDGRLVREVAQDFGMEAELLPVLSAGTVTENARIICDALEAEADGSVVLVSLSKGSADVRIALRESETVLRKVRVWVQICGLLRGSPVLDRMLQSSWWQRGLLRGYLTYRRISVRMVEEMAQRPGALLSAPATTPPGVTVINVLACPLTAHLGGSVRAGHSVLAPLGPNDGYTLLREAILEPGLVYPIWGADHYFRVPEVSRCLYRLFLYLAEVYSPGPVKA